MKQWVLLLMLFGAVLACAQERDPTMPPAAVGATTGQDSGASLLPQGTSVVVQNGKPHLVVGARLYAVGQKIGDARIARITETEIWLKQGAQTTKVPRFPGIVRTVAKPPACKQAKSASTPAKRAKAAPPVQSCAEQQP